MKSEKVNAPFRFSSSFLLTAFLLAVMCSAGTVEAEPPSGKKWKLVWSDEFNGGRLDGAKWEKVGDWPRRGALWLKENAYLDGKGNLVIRSKKEGSKYSCGGVRTRGRFMHTFGYYEIRCKVPDEVGTWAAFWLFTGSVGRVGEGGRDGAEIDIFEAVWRDEDKVNIAIHWDGYGKDHKSAAWKTRTAGVNEGFHTFGLDWTPEEYVFYYDGKEIKRTSAGGACQVPLYIKVTSEIGNWAGDIAKADLPDYFTVDYVRVYDVDRGTGRGVESKKGPSPRSAK